ncbi:helix-turn-helix transcriptional regulator [Ruminococcaceae bacterium OttesenSCG-928-L11]|nr:helix-turn-helix transcriptional regulator [Ruminococcaceae bacterium OttesenSCG-928-L11]
MRNIKLPDKPDGATVKASALIWLAILFSMMAVFLSDFAVPWDARNILYELTTILGLVVTALVQDRYRDRAWISAVAGAGVSTAAALCIEVTYVSPALFILLRLGLSAMLVYTFWGAGMLIHRYNSYFSFTLCALTAYAALSLIQRFRSIALHFGLVYAVCACLCALFLLLSRRWIPRCGQDEAPPPSDTQPAGVDREESHCIGVKDKHFTLQRMEKAFPSSAEWRASFQTLLPAPRRRRLLILFAILLVVTQLFNSFDMHIFSLFSQSSPEKYGAAFPASIFLIGIGYFLGGFLAQKRGLSVLFVVSCALAQFFLLLSLASADVEGVRFFLLFYMMSSAGIDLCVILFPIALCRDRLSPSQSVAGFAVLRVFKLYLIPPLFPEQWQPLLTSRLVVIGTILLAMGQMLLVIHIVISKKNFQLAQWRDHSVAPEPAEAAPPAVAEVPSTLTPREREVFTLLLAGKDRSDIAASMGISSSTVNKHCVSVYRKTECSGHLELLNKYGYRSGEDPCRPSGFTV